MKETRADNKAKTTFAIEVEASNVLEAVERYLDAQQGRAEAHAN